MKQFFFFFFCWVLGKLRRKKKPEEQILIQDQENFSSCYPSVIKSYFQFDPAHLPSLKLFSGSEFQNWHANSKHLAWNQAKSAPSPFFFLFVFSGDAGQSISLDGGQIVPLSPLISCYRSLGLSRSTNGKAIRGEIQHGISISRKNISCLLPGVSQGLILFHHKANKHSNVTLSCHLALCAPEEATAARGRSAR